MDTSKPNWLVKKLFIFNFLKQRNVKEAAIQAGFPETEAVFEGMKFLGKKSVTDKINNLSKKLSDDPYLINAGLERLSFGSVNDAVSLVFAEDTPTPKKIESLDLFNVSDIKRDKNGGVEIKFFDRQKALEKLWEMKNTAGVTSSAESFLDALCNSSVSNNEKEDESQSNEV